MRRSWTRHLTHDVRNVAIGKGDSVRFARRDTVAAEVSGKVGACAAEIVRCPYTSARKGKKFIVKREALDCGCDLHDGDGEGRC